MKPQKKLPIPFYVLSGVAAVLAIGFTIGNSVAGNYKDVINKAFNLSSTKTIEASNTDAIDTQYFKSDYANNEELKKADMDVAERLTEEGAVLLKNENQALPISKTASVTVLGHSSVNALVCGTGSADINADGAPTLYESLTARGVKVNKTVWDYYTAEIDNYATNPKKGDNSIRGGDGTVKGAYTINEIPWTTLTAASGVSSSFSSYKDAAIVVVSRLGGEMYDLPADTDHKGNDDESPTGNALELSYNEIELIKQAKANFDKVVVLINSANPLECDFLTQTGSNVDAALWIGYTGLRGLEGVADLLVGNSNPSGRLVDTYCNDNTTNPAMQNFYSEEWSNSADWGKDMVDNSLDGNKYFNAYQEGIYVGYRYYETRYEDYVYGKTGVGEYSYANDVAYPFGYGLSYTTFEYSTPEYKDNGDSIDITLTVKNSGSVAGKDVVEAYFQSEYTDYDKNNGIEKSAVELCGFAKTSLLEAGASEKVTIKVEKKEFATYDANKAGTYIMDAGNYYLAIGNNAHDALNNIIAKKGSGNDTNKMTKVNQDATTGDASYTYTWKQESIDDTTYSVGNDGNKIQNQFATASLSYYGGTDMNYLSRSNWTSTWPTHQKFELNQKMHDEMTGIKDYTKVTVDGEKMPTMGATNGKSLISMRGKAFDDEGWDSLLDQLTYQDMCRLIGIGYHGTLGLTSVGKPTTKDENGPQGFSGSLTDLSGNAQTMCAYTDENIMAATWNVTLMEEVGAHIGEDGLALGYSGLYGPAMNTHRTAYSGRNFEYYSEDGFLAGKIAAAECKGIQSKGVYVFIKHFALNDEETKCRTISTFSNEQAIREVYLKPFQLAVMDGGAHNVMTAFARVGVVWSSAHEGLMTNVLRNEWGMDGFAVSDYTTTGAATTAHQRTTYDPFLAVMAGTDTFDSSAETSQAKFLLRYDYQGENDTHLVNKMRLASKRILYTVANSNAMNGLSDGTVILSIMNWWEFAIMDGIIYSCILFLVFGIIAVIKTIGYKKYKDEGQN